MADPNTLTVLQGKTFRVIFKMADSSSNPISLAGYGATFTVYNRAGGSVSLTVNDTMAGDPDTTGNTDAPVIIEPAGATGQINVRLGSDQTATLTRDGVYDMTLYSLTDSTEVEEVAAGPLTIVLKGADTAS